MAAPEAQDPGPLDPQSPTALYNATFTYPEGGAVEYVRALLRDLPEHTVALEHGKRVLALEKGRAGDRFVLGGENAISAMKIW